MQIFVISFAVFFVLCLAYTLQPANILLGIWQAAQGLAGLGLIAVVLLIMLACMLLAGLYNLCTTGRFWS